MGLSFLRDLVGLTQSLKGIVIAGMSKNVLKLSANSRSTNSCIYRAILLLYVNNNIIVVIMIITR